MKIKANFNRGILFIRLIGNIDHDGSKQINQYLIPLILNDKIKNVVVNFYEVLIIDEFGMDALQNLKCAIKANKGKLFICETNNNIDGKLSSLKIDKVFTNFKNLTRLEI